MRILIVEDERALCNTIARSLRNLAYSVDCCHDGQEALDLLGVEVFDLVVLDLNLPRIDGMTVLRELRKTDCETKVLILSARGEVSDKVAGLDTGANDYLTKPFRPTVLLMRVKALLRRAEMSGDKKSKGKVLKHADLTYSEDEHSVFADKTAVPLTKTEMSLLAFMMEEPQKTHSRDSLLDKIWGFDEDTETRAIDETVRRIRKKLSAAKSVVTIETVWGYGYKLSAAVKDE